MRKEFRIRWHEAYSRLRECRRQYIKDITATCVKGEIDLNTYVRLKREREEQTKFLLHLAMRLKGQYAVLLIEHLAEHWQMPEKLSDI